MRKYFTIHQFYSRLIYYDFSSMITFVTRWNGYLIGLFSTCLWFVLMVIHSNLISQTSSYWFFSFMVSVMISIQYVHLFFNIIHAIISLPVMVTKFKYFRVNLVFILLLFIFQFYSLYWLWSQFIFTSSFYILLFRKAWSKF